MKIIAKNEKETKIIGQKLGQACLDLLKKDGLKESLVILLFGNLGSGKTTFVKGFSKAFKIKEENIISPSFIIYNKFRFRSGFLYHFDLYRINEYKDLLKLGFKDILKQKNVIVLIEWADKLKNFKFKNVAVVEIYFQHKSGDKRKIIINE